MDSHKTNASLDALQVVINDVLVQTGKAIRSTTKDGNGNVVQSPGATQSKLPDNMRIFHSALDDLENEIIKAKSILQRDLTRLQMPKSSVIKPEPVEAQSKSPMVIGIDSSPQALKREPTAEPVSENQSVAPFPDMGMDMSVAAPKEEPSNSSVADASSAMQSNPIADMDFTAPVPIMDQGESDQQLGASGPAEAAMEGPASDLNFTTMQFSLAPPDEGQQPDMNPSDAFGLGVYNNTDHGQDDLSLGLLPDDSMNNGNGAIGNSNQSQIDLTASQGGVTTNQSATDGAGAAANASMSDEAMNSILNMDLTGDGNDFDFSLDGDTFNDLMNSHDEGNFDTGMEHGQFDDDFFGLTKTDGS